MTSHLPADVRAATAAKLRQAADLLDAGEEAAAGKVVLSGIGPVLSALKANLGPLWIVVREMYVKPYVKEHLG